MTEPAVANVLREQLRDQGRPAACSLVIFGASGDLTRRKLVPALSTLFQDRLLDPSTEIIGFARRDWSDETFRDRVRSGIEEHARLSPPDEAAWNRFAGMLHYVSGRFEDARAYMALREALEAADARRGRPAVRVFYLATPPSQFQPILKNLAACGLALPEGDGAGAGAVEGPANRLIIEKPFGHDLESARELGRAVSQAFSEDQIYRIDHYLGKETVQNILVLRLGNGIFEPLWNRRHVDHVQITVAESLGMEGRGAYYEEAGILRDMLQNHMMQLLCLTAMEPPVRFEADAVRDEKSKVLRAIRPYAPEEVRRRVVRGQYAAGATGGVSVEGYHEEPGVAEDSCTETYLALQLEIESWRWAGVPFYLRSGKRLPRRATEIAITFREPPHLFFRASACAPPEANVLSMRIQPDEGISLSFVSKTPGTALHLSPVRMDFLYEMSFGEDAPLAYERLLLDCLRGDSTLFARRDEVELAWEIADSIVAGWKLSGETSLPQYEAGTWGPREADDLIGKSGRSWRRL